MNGKRPYDHLLKNLLHENAREIVPLLLPEYTVDEVLDLEMPDLESIPVERPPSALEEGLVGMIIPDAKVLKVYKTRWIEHSGVFERAYRLKSSETEKPTYLAVEFQIEREDEELPRRLLENFASIMRYIHENIEVSDGKVLEDEQEMKEETEETGERTGTIVNREYYLYPAALCAFPQNVPAPIRDEFMGRVMLEFNFQVIDLWERDARECLNRQVRPIYFLLPAMKNADATLLGLAITELMQQFKQDLPELARHLTGLSMMLQRSETMAEEEKLAARKHLEPFVHLLDETLI